ncbi:hypothetical protein LPJ72_006097, partial [Coemansia sp. Benny D160-2]
HVYKRLANSCAVSGADGNLQITQSMDISRALATRTILSKGSSKQCNELPLGIQIRGVLICAPCNLSQVIGGGEKSIPICSGNGYRESFLSGIRY